MPVRGNSTVFALRYRLLASALMLVCELLTITIAVDTKSLVHAPGLAGLAGAYGAAGLRLVVLSVAFSLAFAGIAGGSAIAESGAIFERRRYGTAAAVHAAIFGAFAAGSVLLCDAPIHRPAGDFLVLVTAAAGIGTILSCATVLVRVHFWQALLRAAPRAPLYGIAAAAVAVLAIRDFSSISKPWMILTSSACYRVLHLFVSNVVYDARSFTLGTPRFDVTISAECSGYEGIALIVAFSSAWLWFFRREFRFPRALLMIPAGVAASWVLNVCRIVALILIGDAGAPRVATGGFHSQAGWIAFILLAISLALVFQRSSWTAYTPQPRHSSPSALSTETAAYLAPFLAILAAGIVAQAASSGFEWLYPLRVGAAAFALWKYRATVCKLNWRVGGGAAALGVAVFLVWMIWDRFLGGGGSGVPADLAQAPAWLRFGWIASRTVGAVITVPIAEELAFRGYLLRRLASADFTAVSFRGAPPLALVGSSLIFGALHGRFWAPGILAGLLYATAIRRHGRIGDAVAAHAITNALLSVWVLATGEWRLW